MSLFFWPRVFRLRSFRLTIVLLAALALPPSTTTVHAQSAELMQHYRQYQVLKKAGKYRDAIPYAKRALELGKKEFGFKHETYALLLSDLAELYGEMENFLKAEKLYKRSLAIYEKKPGPNHTDLAICLNNLAVLYQTQGKYRKALSPTLRSLAIIEKNLGTDHLELAASLNNLAVLYKKLENYKKAESLYLRSQKIKEKKLGKQHPLVAAGLNNLASFYESQGQYSKAERLYLRSLAIWEAKLGPEHLDVATSLNNLAGLYQKQLRYKEAENLYRRALAIKKKKLGAGHLGLALSFANIASLFHDQGKLKKAENYYRRALSIKEKKLGRNHPDVGIVLNNLAELYKAQGRYKKAEALYKREIVITRKAFGRNHISYAVSQNNLADLYEKQGHYKKAEILYRSCLVIHEKKLGSEHPSTLSVLNNIARLYEMQGFTNKAKKLYANVLTKIEKKLGHDHLSVATISNNLASIYKLQGRYKEAIHLYKKGLEIQERTLGHDHYITANSINNLASVYDDQGRKKIAEALYKRSLAIREKVLGKQHPAVAVSLNNLGDLYQKQEDYEKALPLLLRSLAIKKKKFGPEHPAVAVSLSNLATLYEAQGRYNDAKLLYMRSLDIKEKKLGREHLSVATTLNNLAGLRERLGQYDMARTLYERSLAIRKKNLDNKNPLVSATLNNIASLYFVQKEWAQATQYWRQAADILKFRVIRDEKIGQGQSGKRKNEIAQNSWYFWGLVKSVFRKEGPKVKAQINELFQSAQWAVQSEAAGALAQMSARQAAGNGELAVLVRERQDKVREWQALEKLVNKKRSAGKNHKELDRRMARLDRRISEIDKRLAKDFPDYAALASPRPLSIKQVQKLLQPDEALVLLLDTPEARPTPAETFIWAVTRERAVWKRAPLGGKALAAKVALLRKELDPSTATRSTGKKRGFAPARQSAGFSLDTAHELYEKLLGPVEKLIADKKHLMIVASGPLTALPFQVLVRSKADGAITGDEKYRRADWLIRHHAITTLPSVSSLKALRGIEGKGAAAPSGKLVGFADPVFRPPTAKPVQVASADPPKHPKRLKRSVQRGYASFFKGRNVDLQTLAASLPQLDGTRRELLAIGKTLGVKKQNLFLGRKASERAVKKAALDRYRIVYFATHGLIAGDVKGLGEPALAFSLPAKATPEDDGLLTASEVTELKLNADWLVMSACNTAAGDRPGAEALSGLARAFFYAGAKTLLVSHWPVGDEAAVALTTRAFAAIKAHPELGKSQALRRAMLALIDKGGMSNTHPTVWAPFVVVGEGGNR